MAFILGYTIGSVVTLYLVYRVGKKKKKELEEQLASSAQCLNDTKNIEEGD